MSIYHKDKYFVVEFTMILIIDMAIHITWLLRVSEEIHSIF